MKEIYMTSSKAVRFTCHGIPDEPGMLGAFLLGLGEAGVSVIHIYNTEHVDAPGEIMLTVKETDYEEALAALKKTAEEKGTGEITEECGIAVLNADLSHSDEDHVPSVAIRLGQSLCRYGIDVLHLAVRKRSVFLALPFEKAGVAYNLINRELREGTSFFHI